MGGHHGTGGIILFDEYSIEQRATQIFDSRTKEYFVEVHSSYLAGNYRSSVVMLWSVAICDLLFKLQYLFDIHKDRKAREILDEIGRLQEADERSPIWEKKLIELVAEKTQLLEIAERENLLHLQKQRHLAAHPIINASFQLHRPNRDTSRSLIRNTLDGILTKAPILSNKIIDELVEDLEQVSDILIDEKKLKGYLDSKYYTRFNPEVEKVVFKALWKFVFLLTNEKCNKNRSINYRALHLLYRRNPSQFKEQINANKDYFSAIATGGDPLDYLIYFLSGESSIFGLLADHTKLVIQHASDSNSFARCLAWFTATSLADHAARLDNWISRDNPDIDTNIWNVLWEISDSPEWSQMVIRLANKYYTSSNSFDMANRRFKEAITPNLNNYKLDDCVNLIEGIQRNSQTWQRRHAEYDHTAIRDRILQLDPNFDITVYEHFI